jgi:hypothetical protein
MCAAILSALSRTLPLATVTAAAMQVARTGSEVQRKHAAEILAEARRKIYGLLAED